MHAPPPPSEEEFAIATPEILEAYDAFLFGVPTRFGSLPAQWFEFWGATGGLWAEGALYGKPAGVFVSTGTPGGGQEVTVRNYLSIFAHHGLIYVPLGYSAAFGEITTLDEVHGGSPWGAGLFAGPTGERQASELEIKIATIQGAEFFKVVSQKYNFAKVDKDAVVSNKQDDVTALKGTNAAVAAENSEEPAAAAAAAPNEEAAPAKQKTTQEKRQAQTNDSDEKATSKNSSSKCCIIM